MGTHPIFESDFDCLTVCLSRWWSLNFRVFRRSSRRRFSPKSRQNTDNSNGAASCPNLQSTTHLNCLVHPSYHRRFREMKIRPNLPNRQILQVRTRTKTPPPLKSSKFPTRSKKVAVVPVQSPRKSHQTPKFDSLSAM